MFLVASGSKEREIVNSGRKVVIQNEQIKIAVGSDGRFTIGTTGGKALLFGFPSEGATSHAHFYLDGSLWGTYLEPGAHPEPAPVIFPPSILGGSVVCRYSIRGVDITQRLTPTYWASRGTALVEYIATNHDTRDHYFGLLLFFDTMINRNDYAPIATQFGYFAESQQFFAPNIPHFWQAYESSPFQSADSLVGQGILIGGEATPPDALVYGNYWRYHGVYWDWTFYAEPYTDSAVLMRWNPVLLRPGESVKIATYYGIGTVDILLGQLNLSVSSPAQLSIFACSEYSPNPFPINLVVTNTMLRVVRNVRATVNLPPEIAIETGGATREINPDSLVTGGTGSCSWLVRILGTFERDTSLCFTVSVSSDDIDSSLLVNSCVSVPAIIPTGPVIEYLSPPYSFTSLDTIGILYRVIDTTGSLPSNIVLYVNGFPERLFESPYIDFSPPNLFARIPSSYIEPADSIAHFLVATDENGCSSRLDAPFVIYIDREPPEVVSVEPENGAVIGGNEYNIVAVITDNRAGVMWDSIFLVINDTIRARAGSLGFSVEGDSLVFSSRLFGLRYSSSESIRVCITGISDNVRIGSPNRAPNFCWRFYLDVESPRARIISPSPNSIISCDVVDISVQLFAASGIDSHSIIFNINGTVYSITNPNVWFDGNIAHMRFIPPRLSGRTYRIAFTASNNAGVALADSLVWSFRVDFAPPFISDISPPNGSTIYIQGFPISFRVGDDLSGVMMESLSVIVGSRRGLADTIRFGQTGLRIVGDSIAIIPYERGWRYRGYDSVFVRLSVSDSPDTCAPNYASFEWFFFTPSSLPSVSLVYPSGLRFVSCDSILAAFLVSSMVPIDTYSIMVEEHLGTSMFLYSFSDGPIGVVGDTIFVAISGYSSGDSVLVRIVSLNDIFDNGIESFPDFRFVADFEPPIFFDISPSHGDTIDEPHPIISFAVHDSLSGLDSMSVQVSIDGELYELSRGLDLVDGRYVLNTESVGIVFRGGLEKRVCFRANDNASICGANTNDTCVVFYVSSKGPDYQLISPPESTVVACPDVRFLFLIDDSTGIDESSIRLIFANDTFDINSPYMSLIGDTLVFVPPLSLLGGDGEFFVVLDGLKDILGNDAENLPHSWFFVRDFMPPLLIGVAPGYDDTVGWVYQPIRFAVADSISGVYLDSILIVINGRTFSLADSAVYILGDSVVFNPYLAGLRLDSTVNIELRLLDSPDLCYNEVWYNWRFFVDSSPPRVVGFEPHPGVLSCDPFRLYVYIFDREDINIDILMFNINGESLTCENLNCYYSNNLLTFDIPPRFLVDGSSLEISIMNLFDIYGNGVSDVVMEAEYMLDFSPPYFKIIYPQPGDTISGGEYGAAFLLGDMVAGLDYSSVRFNVNGVAYEYSSPGFAFSGDTVRFDPYDAGVAIVGGMEIRICVYARDNVESCGANELDTCFSYYINSTGPVFVPVMPRDGSISHMVDQRVVFSVHDDDRVDVGSLVVYVDGVRYRYDSGSIEFRDTSIVFIPPFNWGEGVHRVVVSGADRIHNLSRSDTLVFYIDLSPPLVLDPFPSPEMSPFESLQEMGAKLVDSISGVDPTSIIISINNDTLRYGFSPLYWDGERVFVRFSDLGVSPRAGERYRFCVLSVSDMRPDYGEPNILTEPYCFTVELDYRKCLVYPLPFTPNDDGFNDRVFFEFPGAGGNYENVVEIFTLDGRKIKNITYRTLYDGKPVWMWDGRADSNKEVSPGVYIYLVKSNGKVICSGVISLMR